MSARKTTVARLLANVFMSVGLLATNETVVLDASDMQTGFVGQAAQKTRDIFEKARGKLLFIDEAYQLAASTAPGGAGASFMGEAVDKMTALVTTDEFNGKMVLVLAGYPTEIEHMLRSVNPGFARRFRAENTIVFTPFSARDAAVCLRKMLGNERYALTASDEAVERRFASFTRSLGECRQRRVSLHCERRRNVHCVRHGGRWTAVRRDDERYVPQQP